MSAQYTGLLGFITILQSSCGGLLLLLAFSIGYFVGVRAHGFLPILEADSGSKNPGFV